MKPRHKRLAIAGGVVVTPCPESIPLSEITGARYANPDVTLRMDSIELSPDGRLLATSGRGSSNIYLVDAEQRGGCQDGGVRQALEPALRVRLRRAGDDE